MTDTRQHDSTQQEQQHGRLQDAREAAGNAYAAARAKAKDVAASSRETARRAVEGLDGNPLGLVVGGLAVGALAGALIPRSAREKELLAPVGAQLGQRARSAFEAAREAGRSELADRGLNRDAAKDQVKSLFDNLVKVASTAGSAAAKSARTGG